MESKPVNPPALTPRKLKEYGLQDHDQDILTFQAGQMIFSEGEAGCELFIILEGIVVITIQGREVNKLGLGEVFGEMTLVDDEPRSASAKAVTDCSLAPLDRERFTSMVKQWPDFAIHIMSVTSSRLRRFMEEELKRQRLEEEMKIGRQMQINLLPDQCPTIEGWDLAATYRPAREVGGDLYDFIIQDDVAKQFQFVIADVTGKGVPAALFMASARTAFRAESQNGRTPGEILSRTNQLIFRDVKSPLFLSAFFAILDTQTGQVSFANGGHEPPFWYQHKSDTLVRVPGAGMLLGAFEGVRYEEQQIELEPGDFLVFFTDGVTEARNKLGEFYGEDLLGNVINSFEGGSAFTLLHLILRDIASFVGDTPAADDLTLVVIRKP
jgi:serine phosphatase RsbU (regulator of sigma subunit)